MNRALLSARARASLLSGAVGDAWGGPYEGRRGPLDAAFPERPRVSDDTWLTLATCDAIAGAGGLVTPDGIAATFREWFEAGRLPGLGSATLKALRDLAAGGHWAMSGARGEFAAGSGAAMRIAPLAFMLDPARDDDRVLIRDVSRITHHSEEAYAGALAVACAIRLCAGGAGIPDDLLGVVAAMLPDTRVRDRILELRMCDGDSGAVASRFGSSGYVVEAVPLALFVAARCAGDGLASVLQQAIAPGGDTDTVASIAGQVAGAAGIEVPPELLRRIQDVRDVEACVERFAGQIRDPRPPGTPPRRHGRRM